MELIAEKPAAAVQEGRGLALSEGMERDFSLGELFFSLTDSRGVITYANEVFVRISAYSLSDLLGKPHNVIRHPDMPRAVFKLFWELLQAGQPVAAYVKNRARDGLHYWVLALAFPCPGGYLSVRLKPTSPLFGKVREIYRQMLALERQTSERRTGMAQAGAHLLQSLRSLGYADYPTFMHAALEAEMRARKAALAADAGSTGAPASGGSVPLLATLEAHLERYFGELDSLKRLNATLVQNAEFVIELARSIKIHSLNAQINSIRMGAEGLALAVVAEKMGDQSNDAESILVRVQEEVGRLGPLLTNVVFDIVAARLQVEMTANFTATGLGSEGTGQGLDVREVYGALHTAYARHLDAVFKVIEGLPRRLGALQQEVERLERVIQILRFIHFSGKVESARVRDASHFAATFEGLISEVEEAARRLAEFSGFIATNVLGSRRLADGQESLRALVAELEKSQPGVTAGTKGELEARSE